jgi:ATP-binding cassette subfamily B protein
LQRETGKLIRIVSKGAQSFNTVLRFYIFNISPLILELGFLLAVLAVKYDGLYFWLTFGTLLSYFLATVCLTEYRAKFFKA